MNGHVSSLDGYEAPPTPVIENFFHKKFSKVKRRPGSSSAESEPESNGSESSTSHSKATTKLIVENNNLISMQQNQQKSDQFQNNLIITNVKEERMDDSDSNPTPQLTKTSSFHPTTEDTSPFKPVAITVRKPCITDTLPPRPPYTLAHPPISAFAPPVAPPTAPFHPHPSPPAPFHPHPYPALLLHQQMQRPHLPFVRPAPLHTTAARIFELHHHRLQLDRIGTHLDPVRSIVESHHSSSNQNSNGGGVSPTLSLSSRSSVDGGSGSGEGEQRNGKTRRKKSEDIPEWVKVSSHLNTTEP